jgi:hypothetical protein
MLNPTAVAAVAAARAQAGGARLRGALLRSQTYGREEIGLDGSAVAKNGWGPIDSLAVQVGDKVSAQAQWQTRRAEAAHLLDAFGIHTLARLLMR